MAVDMIARMMAMGNGGGGTSDAYTKAQTDALLGTKVDKETGKGLSTNDYTTAEKDKLAGVASGAEVNVQSDWSQSDSSADDYIKNKPTIPTVNDATLTIQKNGTAVGTFSANAATAATINITVPVDADDVSALPDTTKYGASLSLSIDSSTYVVTASLKDQDGNTLGTAQTIDLPLETVVVGGSFDDTTKKVILTLKNGNTIDFSVADLVAGLQTEITSTNKLDADLVDDTTSVHKFVTAADKTAWNAKSDFSGDYDDLTNKPTIPAAQVNADWNATYGVARIFNKPTIYTKSEADTLLADKVDKVTGKGLSTEDYTTTEKAKLETIEAGAEVNVQANWAQTTTTANDYIKNKPTLGTAAAKNYTSSVSSSSDLVTSEAVNTALAGKQSTLTTAQQNAVNSGITASIVNKTSALINGLYMVASVAGGNGNQSLEYTVNRSDFNTMSGAGVDYTGTYLIHCIEWSTEGKPYIGLITFSGGQFSNLTKTDVATGFTPNITIDGDKFTISGAARISVYALR